MDAKKWSNLHKSIGKYAELQEVFLKELSAVYMEERKLVFPYYIYGSDFSLIFLASLILSPLSLSLELMCKQHKESKLLPPNLAKVQMTS